MELEISPSPVVLSHQSSSLCVCSVFSPLQAPGLGETHISSCCPTSPPSQTSSRAFSLLAATADGSLAVPKGGGIGGCSAELCHSTERFPPGKERGIRQSSQGVKLGWTGRRRWDLDGQSSGAFAAWKIPGAWESLFSSSSSSSSASSSLPFNFATAAPRKTLQTGTGWEFSKEAAGLEG